MNVNAKLSLTTLILSLFLIISSCGGSSNIEVGAPAPDIKTTLSDGTDFTLSSLKGDYVLLDFWGSWCPPCLKEAPAIVALHNEYKSAKFENEAGFQLVSVAMERNDRTWQKTANRYGMSWPLQLVDISRFVATSDIGSDYGVVDIPAKFLIAPDGTFLSVKGSMTEIQNILKSRRK